MRFVKNTRNAELWQPATTSTESDTGNIETSPEETFLGSNSAQTLPEICTLRLLNCCSHQTGSDSALASLLSVNIKRPQSIQLLAWHACALHTDSGTAFSSITGGRGRRFLSTRCRSRTICPNRTQPPSARVLSARLAVYHHKQQGYTAFLRLLSCTMSSIKAKDLEVTLPLPAYSQHLPTRSRALVRKRAEFPDS